MSEFLYYVDCFEDAISDYYHNGGLDDNFLDKLNKDFDNFKLAATEAYEEGYEFDDEYVLKAFSDDFEELIDKMKEEDFFIKTVQKHTDDYNDFYDEFKFYLM